MAHSMDNLTDYLPPTLFHSNTVLETHRLQNLFLKESRTQGKHFDDPASVSHINPFIKTYKLDLTELLEEDVTKYRTFNEFFYRKLKKDARPIDGKDDPVSLFVPAFAIQ